MLANLGRPIPDGLPGQPAIDALDDPSQWSPRRELLTESDAGWALRDGRYKVGLPQRGLWLGPRPGRRR